MIMSTSVSVVIPTMNSAVFLEPALLSVIDQDYPCELILIDGGSTDATFEIIRKYKQHVSIMVSEPDNGQSDALNKGFLKASGDLIFWLNSDDYLLGGAIKAHVAAYMENPDCQFFYSNYIWQDELKNTRRVIKPLEEYSRFLNAFYGCYIPTSGSSFTRDFLKVSGLLDTNFKYKMDTEIFDRSGYRDLTFKKIDGVWSVFRYHGDNVSFRDKSDLSNKKIFSRQEMESIIIKDRNCKIAAYLPLMLRSGLYKVLWSVARFVYVYRKYF